MDDSKSQIIGTFKKEKPIKKSTTFLIRRWGSGLRRVEWKSIKKNL